MDLCIFSRNLFFPPVLIITIFFFFHQDPNFDSRNFQLSQLRARPTTEAPVDLIALFVLSPLLSSPYGSMARKRSAQEGVGAGAPVNKRKSLLMKPRHYSPTSHVKRRARTWHRHRTKKS
uniref:Uncharacterized protein n=1 Tax=Myripristis murdjan TaxID=586833 RepID=A0A667ZKT5_9TELE